MTSKRQLREDVTYYEGVAQHHIDKHKDLTKRYDDLNRAAVALCQERDDYRDRLIATDKAMNDRLVAAERERDDLRRQLSDIRNSFETLRDKVYPGLPAVQIKGVLGGSVVPKMHHDTKHIEMDWAGLR